MYLRSSFYIGAPAACPALAKVPQVLVIHGEGDGTLDNMKVERLN